MSCHVVYYENRTKMMRPVNSREEYLALRNGNEQAATLARARKGSAAAKRRLLQMVYSCLPNDDGSLKGSTRMSGCVGMDVDIARNEGEDDADYRARLEAIPQRVLEKKDALGLRMLERSVNKGFHLVFARRWELSQEDNLRWASELLGISYDAGAKDITRVFFTTSASEDDLLFLSDELFEEEEGAEDCRAAAEEVEPPAVDQESCAMHEDVCPKPCGSSPEDYQGVPYRLIVEALENQLGGVPEHGSRNQFIFAMACHLRYVCDDSPEWIAEVLPDYGESRERWMSTIRSACRRSQNKQVPRLLRTAIDLAKGVHEGQKAGDAEGTLPPPMPRRLPPLIKLLLSKTPAIYQPAVAHAVFPSLAAHLWKTRFRYIDNVEHEATLMNVLMAGTGAGKNCIAAPIDCIMKDIRERDAISMEKERQWKEEVQSKGANKDKRARPEGIVVQEVDADMTNAAFVLRLSEAEEHFLYVRMNEIDQFDALKTSARSKSQFQIMCLAFDPGNTYGQTRVGLGSVSARVCIRFNWNASTTVIKGQQYFKNVLTDGPVSRINFCTIPEQPIGSEMPVYGTYDADFEAELKPYINNLNAARGLVECPQAVRLAKKLKEENADFARLSQSRTYENLSYRANVIAYLKAMVLYVAQGFKWDKSIEEFVRWSERYDLWCKMKFFGDAIDKASGYQGNATAKRPGPKNLLDELGERFTTDEALAVRRRHNLPSDHTRHMLSTWKTRGYIADDPEGQADIWVKTEKYHKKVQSQISDTQLF